MPVRCGFGCEGGLELSSREVAVVFWGMVGLSVALRSREVRASFKEMFAAALNRQTLSVAAFLGLWTVGEVIILRTAGLWTELHLKDTLIWFGFVGVVFAGSGITGYSDPDYRRAAINGLSVTAVVEFVVAMKPFPLPVELVLVPVLATIGLMSGFASSRPEHAAVKKLMDSLAGLIGAAVIVGAAIQLWGELGSTDGGQVLRSFLLPLALSILLIPAAFILVLQARYEWLFGKLRGSWRYRTYARIRLATKLGARPSAVMDFGRQYAFDLPHVRTARELEEMMKNAPSRHVDLDALRAMAEGRGAT